MNRNLTLTVTALAAVLFISLPLLAQGGPGGRNGVPGSGECAVCPVAPGAATLPLTQDEIKWLLLMREEEKLARDVYVVMYDTWKLNVFRNIPRSEQQHFDAVGILLTRYGLTDPATKERGVFTDATLQDLYKELIVQGEASVTAALQVGVAIEKHDIKDLEGALTATKKTDVMLVYSNLLTASAKHLDAFESHLQILGVNP